MAKNSTPMRLELSLVQAAAVAGESFKRSTASQIEYWAEIGRAVEHLLDPQSIIAIKSGLATLKLEVNNGTPVDAQAVFAKLETDRRSEKLSSKVTSTAVRYQASSDHPGMLERINAEGQIEVGLFQDGEFMPLAM